MTDLDTKAAERMNEMGPIDYVVLEWPREQPTGTVVPMIIDAVDRGTIRIIDVAFVGKDDGGDVYAMELADFDADGTFSEFEGASTGIIGQDDLAEAGGALAPGTAAAVLIWENRWAAPIAVALRESGAQLVASGRIPVQGLLAALDETDADHTTT